MLTAGYDAFTSTAHVQYWKHDVVESAHVVMASHDDMPPTQVWVVAGFTMYGYVVGVFDMRAHVLSVHALCVHVDGIVLLKALLGTVMYASVSFATTTPAAHAIPTAPHALPQLLPYAPTIA